MPKPPTRARIKTEDIDTRPKRRPPWIRVRAPSGDTYEMVHELMRSKGLNTVCEEAHCPNLGECWGAGTATFLMLGDVCTRTCGFCDIKRGQPSPLDWMEPTRIAQAVKSMNLKHAVITSVNRDERADGERTRGRVAQCEHAGGGREEPQDAPARRSIRRGQEHQAG